MRWSTRNFDGLSAEQITRCIEAWSVLCAVEDMHVELDLSRAAMSGTLTGYNEEHRKVYLGANAFPGEGADANSQLSYLACLAHELAHARRFSMGYRRPMKLPDVLLDEAETSIDASFNQMLPPRDRKELVEDARDRLLQWIAHKE